MLNRWVQISHRSTKRSNKQAHTLETKTLLLEEQLRIQYPIPNFGTRNPRPGYAPLDTDQDEYGAGRNGGINWNPRWHTSVESVQGVQKPVEYCFGWVTWRRNTAPEYPRMLWKLGKGPPLHVGVYGNDFYSNGVVLGVAFGLNHVEAGVGMRPSHTSPPPSTTTSLLGYNPPPTTVS